MESIQATLHEGQRLLAKLTVILTQSKDFVAGSFTLPGGCSIKMDSHHHLILADGRSVPIVIKRLSHFSGDVEFEQAPAPVATP